MQTTQSPKAGERTQLMLVDARRQKAACFRIVPSGTGTVIADVYQDDLARTFVAAPRMAELIRRIYDSPDTISKLEAGVVREMQDCLTEAGLIK